uniref:Uncharacterized protein n=1 Tax=Alexandrium monilatum TaxID=311494 RepID=A0A7S4V593_9DINO
MLQKLPAEALVPPCDAAAMMLETRGSREDPPRVLALSYRWLTKEHPDPDGVQLGKVLGFLDEMVLAVFRSREEAATRAELDIGILWDYMSLPQHPRSATEQDLFLRGLKAINRVYGSRDRSLTLQCIGDPDGSHPYHQSGWCRFEEAVSGIGKTGSGLVAVGDEVPQGGLCFNNAVHAVDAHPGEAVLKATGLGEFAGRLRIRYMKLSPLHDWNQLCADMSTSRLPPIHPDEMARLLCSDEVAFTNQSDAQMVIQKYRDFFRKMADTIVRLEYGHRLLPSRSDKTATYAKVTWSPDQFRLLGQALGGGGLRNCKFLSLSGVNLDEAGARILADSLVKAVSLEEVMLPTHIRDTSLFALTTVVTSQPIDPDAIEFLSQKLTDSSLKVSYGDRPV